MGWLDVRHHYEDYDPSDVPECKTLSHRQSVARKWQECFACGGSIEPGQRYSCTVMVIDRKFEIQRIHIDQAQCLEAEAQRRQDEMAANEAALREHSANPPE